jgi:cyclic pyranopterin phosphate synthase
MSKRIIPIQPMLDANGSPSLIAKIPSSIVAPHGNTVDLMKRPLRDLRISVTDRCNFRCTYCMPKSIFDQSYSYLAQSELLSFEEIERLAAIFVSLGVEKIRLTGGEPLLRKNLESLIERLALIPLPSQSKTNLLDLTLTTNGSLLVKKSSLLKNAGLQRITVSLDAIDDAVFKKMNDADYPVSDVLNGIEAAQKAGFESIKVNMVVKKGTNDHQILPMVQHFRNSGITLRFIEFMDVGNSNGWNLSEVLPSADLIALIHQQFPLESLQPNYVGEVAQRWRFADGAGEIGVISSVTQAFCHECSRARLSTDGKLFLCLFANQGFDLKTLLRSGHSDIEIANAVMGTWSERQDRYSQIRHLNTDHQATQNNQGQRKIEMSYIGG